MPLDPATGQPLPYEAPEYDLLDDVLSTGTMLQMFGGDLSGLQRVLQEGLNPQARGMSPGMLGQLPTQPTGFEGLVTGGFEGGSGMTRVGGGFLPSGAPERSALRDMFQSRTGFDPRSAQNWVRLSDGTLVSERIDGELEVIGGAQIDTTRTSPTQFATTKTMGRGEEPAFDTRRTPRSMEVLRGRTADEVTKEVAERGAVKSATIRSAPTKDLTPAQIAEAKMKFAARKQAVQDPALWRSLGDEAERQKGSALLRGLREGVPRDILGMQAKQPTALEAFSGALKTDEDRQSKEAEAKFRRAMNLMGLAEKVESRKQAKEDRAASLAFQRERLQARTAEQQTEAQAKQAEAQQKALIEKAKANTAAFLAAAKATHKDDPAALSAAILQANARREELIDRIRAGENPFAGKDAAVEAAPPTPGAPTATSATRRYDPENLNRVVAFSGTTADRLQDALVREIKQRSPESGSFLRVLNVAASDERTKEDASYASRFERGSWRKQLLKVLRSHLGAHASEVSAVQLEDALDQLLGREIVRSGRTQYRPAVADDPLVAAGSLRPGGASAPWPRGR